MFKSLSKSTTIMFLFDLIILTLSTYFWSNNFNFSLKIVLLSISVTLITGLITLFLKGYYKIREFNITMWNAYRLFEGVVFAHVPVLLLLFFVPADILLKFIGFNILTVFITLYLYRLCFHYYLFNIKKIKKVLIVGANERAKAIVEVIKNKKALQMEVVGIVKSAKIEKTLAEIHSKEYHFDLKQSEIDLLNAEIENEKRFNFEDTKIFENGKDIHDIAEQTNADIVIFTKKTSLVNALPNNIKHYLMPDFYEMATGKCYIDDEYLAEFSYEFMKHPKHFYEIWKRRLDIICSLIILIVTLPITGFVALRIKLTDGKSPFYTQDRVGKGCKIFKAYKLRTMYDNDFKPKDTKKVGYVENQDKDDRVIPWCKFVRKARFDEIPQMVNILKGDMSIVGPRAEWKEVAEVYKKEVKGYPYRMLVDTAWTGWAQINQGYCFASDNEAIKLQYDLYYIKHRNILWDISILVKAVFLALGGRHA